MVFQHHAQGWVYAAFSNHGGENEVIKIGFTSNIETRYASGTREIFYHEPDQRIADVEGYPAGALEQQILGFMEKLGLRISKQNSYSGSTETVRIDPGSVIIIQDAIPSGNRAVDRFISKVLNYLGPTGDPGIRPNSTPGKIIARQGVFRCRENSRDNEVAVDWDLSDLVDDDEVVHRPASRGARSFVGLNPEDWRGLSRVKRA